jgi:hypothetical protein
MGMGKSLSLLALILYTLPSEMSDSKENWYPSSQKDEIWSLATLIITPKSSKSIIPFLEALILIDRNSNPRLGAASQ